MKLSDLLAGDDYFFGFDYRRSIRVFDRGDTIEAVTDLPGVLPDDISVDVCDGYLEVRAKRSDQTVSRSVAIPYEVDIPNVVAACSNGVLTVLLPKCAALKPRRIPVTKN